MAKKMNGNEPIDTTRKIFSTRLLQEREKKKLSRQMVADDLGISRAALEYYEKAKRVPDIVILNKIACYYTVSADYLLGNTNKPSANAETQTHAMWKICSDGYYPYCDNCLYEPPSQSGMTKYCPNCGARMDDDKHKPLHNN